MDCSNVILEGREESKIDKRKAVNRRMGPSPKESSKKIKKTRSQNREGLHRTAPMTKIFASVQLPEVGAYNPRSEYPAFVL